MKPSELKGKKITVMGLGILGGGIGTVKYLAAQKAKVLVTDLKSKRELRSALIQLKSLPIFYVLGKHRKEVFIKTDLIIKNPAVSNNSPFLKLARKHQIPIESDASLFFRFCPAPIIGVTGSKGKSTTVTLLEKMLRRKEENIILVGHNRISVLDRLTKVKKNSLVLFELSSWRLESLKAVGISPRIAIVTNIFPDHLNTYKNISEYQNAKKNIFLFQSKKDFVILNRDNPYTKKFGAEVTSQRFWFSTKYFSEQNGVFLKGGKIYFRKQGKEAIITNISKIKLLGNHNLENILAAICAAKILNVQNNDINFVLKHFTGIPDRLELVRTWKGIKFYNDTSATIPDATIAALKALKGKLILIAGGQDKGLNYFKLAQIIKKRVDHLALIPGSASIKLLKYLGPKTISFSQHQTLPSALKKACKKAKRNYTILFSPAAASFNLFLNEFDRGEQFRKLVKKIP